MQKSIEVVQTKPGLIKENFLLKKKIEEYGEIINGYYELINSQRDLIKLLKERLPERKHALLFHEKNGQCRVLKM